MEDVMKGSIAFSHGDEEIDWLENDDEIFVTDISQSNPNNKFTALYKSPPNIEEAKTIGLNRKIYMPGSRKKLVPIMTPKKNLNFLGVCFPLYFDFIENCIILLLGFFLISGVFSLTTNLASDYCETHQNFCATHFVIRMSWANKKGEDSLVIAQAALNLIATIGAIILTGLLKIRVLQRVSEVDQDLVTPFDYTVRLSRVPSTITDPSVIKTFIKQAMPENKLNINDMEIIRAYDIREMVNLVREGQKKMMKFTLEFCNKVALEKDQRGLFAFIKKKWHSPFVGHAETKSTLGSVPGTMTELGATVETEMGEQKKKEKNQSASTISLDDLGLRPTNLTPKQEISYRRQLAEITEIKKKIQSYKDKELKPSQMVFVTFQNSKDAVDLVNKYSRNQFRRSLGALFRYPKWLYPQNQYLEGNLILFSFPPEPSDILWENISERSRNKMLRRSASMLGSVLILGITLVLLIFINVGKTQIVNDISSSNSNQTYQTVVDTIMSNISAILVTVVGSILSFTTRFFTSFEHRSSYSGYFSSIAEKITFNQLINSAFLGFFANAMGTYIKGTTTASDSLSYAGNASLLIDVFFIFISQSTVVPLMTIFNPVYFKQAFNRWRIRRSKTALQDQTFNIPQNYALVCQLALFACFYISVLPIGSLILAVGLVFLYVAKRIELLRNSAYPNILFNGDICIKMARILESCPIFFTAGNLIWGYILGTPAQAAAICWASFALALLGFFVPKTTLANYLFKKHIGEKCVHNVTFNEAKQKHASCQMTYKLANPITRYDAINETLGVLRDLLCKENKEGFLKKAKELFSHLRDFGKEFIQRTGMKEVPKQIFLTKNIYKSLMSYAEGRLSLQDMRTDYTLEVAGQKCEASNLMNITDTIGSVEKYVGTKLKPNLDNTYGFFKRVFKGDGSQKTEAVKEKAKIEAKDDAKEKPKEKAKTKVKKQEPKESDSDSPQRVIPYNAVFDGFSRLPNHIREAIIDS